MISTATTAAGNSDRRARIDQDGYRKNVGLIVCNARNQLLWARRVNHDGWQFPQGGVRNDETAEAAAFRELEEEVGLAAADVALCGSTPDWLRYTLPRSMRRRHHRIKPGQFRGQKQRWFLFQLISADARVRLDLSDNPEFDQWRWVEYWLPLREIVAFKRHVYGQALQELEKFLPQPPP